MDNENESENQVKRNEEQQKTKKRGQKQMKNNTGKH